MSDNELDAELLAMAGDGSDDEGELDSAVPSAAASPTPEPKQSVEQAEDTSASRRGVAQKVRAKGRRKRRQDSDVEDEASPSPSRSIGSGAMHRSESEPDAPAASDDEDRPLYPLEGKFLSANDRSEILAMPEIKREEILAERAQEVIKRQQDVQLKKALAAAQAAGNKAKRKADAADLEDGGRRTTRPRAEKRSTALDKYKAAREQKGAERSRPSVAKTRRDSRSQSSMSDRDADGESEVEWAEPRSDSRRDRDEPPAELRDFERSRVGRSNFAKVCFYPNFESSIKGCFARVSIGLNRETGQNQYRMAQIRGFTEGKPYQLEMHNGKKFTTDQYAIVAQGSSEKNWPFSACSDGKFTPAELERYDNTLRKENRSLPTRKFLVSKVSDINFLLGQDWTDKQITEKLNKQRTMERKYDPVWQAKVKRDAILERKSEAVTNNDYDEVEKCEAELKELAEANGTKTTPAKPVVLTQQERLAKINMRNRGKNAEDVRRALLEEKRKLKLARAAQLKIMEEKEAAEKAAQDKKSLAVPNGDDLFGEGTDASAAATPANATPKRSRASTPLNGNVKKEKGPVGALRHKNIEDDILADIDFGIDIEI